MTEIKQRPVKHIQYHTKLTSQALTSACMCKQKKSLSTTDGGG